MWTRARWPTKKQTDTYTQTGGMTQRHRDIERQTGALCVCVVADPKILKREEDNLSVPILIYRKCTQRSICLLHRKKQLFEKKF